MDHKEEANASDNGSASIGRSASVTEQAKATGRYNIECLRPKEGFRGIAISLRNAIERLDNSRNLFSMILGWFLLGFMVGWSAPMKMVERAREMHRALCYVAWEDVIENLVCTPGKNDALDKYFAGSTYTAAWYLGLISLTGYTTGPAVGDTMASHGGWAEDQNYSAGTRPAPTWNAASGGSKATTATSYSINATTTVKGCFATTNNTKGGTTGILYSAGLFSGGDKAVGNGDTLNVTYTASL